MHLIHGQSLSGYSEFYQNKEIVTRTNSLPFIFRKLRIHRNLTRRSLAQKLGVTENYIYRVESGQKIPSLKFSMKCAHEFGINPEYVKRKWFRAMMDFIGVMLKKRLNLED